MTLKDNKGILWTILSTNLITYMKWKKLFCFVTGFHYVTQAGLELSILLPQPHEYWDYKHGLQCPGLDQSLERHNLPSCISYKKK
jgi:hypothetical protein